ncbi:HAD family hydrolase [Streptomyces sp. RFCAC02]|uniref:HAD family hydrolase n=1 Tax=Streptomyces sp. RFCAC02 TaxID=2499143 RepID=UPI001021C87B|nr:HAD family hydrolase [Streptomyces sp. RFCAC02]
MPLLLIDLDNTLIDRDGAFREAAAAFLAGHALPEADVAWVMAADEGGYATRESVADALRARYGGRVPEAAVRALVDGGAADRVVLADTVRAALTDARALGWTCAVVTNGRTRQQETKIRRTGLDTLVDGWAVSEAVGHAKPAPALFHAAAGAAGASVDPATTWVVGDSAHADIGGAHALGLRSVWVANGRDWPAGHPFTPTRTAPDAAAAIRGAVTAGDALPA